MVHGKHSVDVYLTCFPPASLFIYQSLHNFKFSFQRALQSKKTGITYIYLNLSKIVQLCILQFFKIFHVCKKKMNPLRFYSVCSQCVHLHSLYSVYILDFLYIAAQFLRYKFKFSPTLLNCILAACGILGLNSSLLGNYKYCLSLAQFSKLLREACLF